MPDALRITDLQATDRVVLPQDGEATVIMVCPIAHLAFGRPRVAARGARVAARGAAVLGDVVRGVGWRRDG